MIVLKDNRKKGKMIRRTKTFFYCTRISTKAIFPVSRNMGGGAARWAGWVTAHPKCWLVRPQCI